VPELIRTENTGRSTKVYVAGIEIGKILKDFSFEQTGKSFENPNLMFSFGILDMIRLLSKLTEEEISQAKEILKCYINRYKETAD